MLEDYQVGGAKVWVRVGEWRFIIIFSVSTYLILSARSKYKKQNLYWDPGAGAEIMSPLKNKHKCKNIYYVPLV